MSASCLKACSRKPSVMSDASLDDFDADLAIRRSLWRKQKLLPPLEGQMPFRHAFETLLRLLMWYTGFVVPFTAAFRIGYRPAQLVVDYIVDFLFWIDIGMTLRTAYYDDNQELVVDSNKIKVAYLRKRMHLDVIANIPWELFTLIHHRADSPTFASWKLFRMLRFFRIMKIHRPNLINVNDSGARRLVLFFPIMTHWTACIWWHIGFSEYTRYDPTDFATMRGQGVLPWLVRPPEKGYALGYNSGLAQNYFSSVYWAASTLMKTAWIHPSLTPEKVFACLIVLLGAIMFAVILGQINQTIRRIDESMVQRRDKISTFRQFCNQNKLDASTTRKVISYAMAEWNVTQGVSMQVTTKLLSPVLRGELMYEMRKDLLENNSCPLLSATSAPFAKMLLSNATVQVCLKNEHLLGFGQMARELFVLNKGSLQISIPAKERKAAMAAGGGPVNRSMSKKTQFRILEKQGSTTGLWNPYENNMRYPFEVVAKEFSSLLNIPRQAIFDAMNDFSGDRAAVVALLENEYNVTMQALKVMNKSIRPSACSPTTENPDETMAAESGSARLRQVNATLEGIGCTLVKAVSSISQVHEDAAMMQTILGVLGSAGWDSASTPRRRLTAADVHEQAEARVREQDQKMKEKQKDRRGAKSSRDRARCKEGNHCGKLRNDERHLECNICDRALSCTLSVA